MKIDDLESIALEGGGGKGAVYKGAILALEKKFQVACSEGKLTTLAGNAPVSMPTLGPPYAPLLDYLDQDGAHTKIKGISGASAGAITAFPLALGLGSEDIEEILHAYPFNEEFLPNNELHAGKYRMVGMDGQHRALILVAEDHFRKLGEDAIAFYRFSAVAKSKIGGNWLKAQVRTTVVLQVFKIFLAGLKERIGPVRAIAETIRQAIERNLKPVDRASEPLTTTARGIVASLKVLTPSVLDYLISAIDSMPRHAVLLLIKKLAGRVSRRWKILHVLPANHLAPAIGNIVWDRGIYAGFEVRDFFYRIMLKALSKDTLFRRGLLKSDILGNLGLEPEQLEGIKLTFSKGKYEVTGDDSSKEALDALAYLPELLTFEALHDMTGLNFCVCVTNATSSQPLYFSHYFTPDFPVLEAVGASMNFPLVFKPTYNEACVLNSSVRPPDFVNFKPARNPGGIGVYKESFAMAKYNERLSKVLAFLKAHYKLKLATNGNLSFRSFLPYLRRALELGKFEHAEMERDCHFFYNAAFKGLLIDGGVTNNLPISVFTYSTTPTDAVQDLAVKTNVLSLKLDNSFPPEMREAARVILEKDAKLLQRLTNIEDKAVHLGFAARVFKGAKLKRLYKRGMEEGTFDFGDMSKEVWVKISKELVEEYKQTHAGFTPWNRQVDAISGLANALQFGLDQGQIENIADNDNIISLYCYGLGTLDFDLKKPDLEKLVEKANIESERMVFNYFE